MNIDSLQTGIVIDHIEAGMSMRIYDLLKLDRLDCCVAVIKNARSSKYGRKDIIKVEGNVNIDLDVLAFLDPDITVNFIENGHIIQKKTLELPEYIKNVITCKNPRCITTIEEGVDQVFRLCDAKTRRYRCIYCEQEYERPHN